MARCRLIPWPKRPRGRGWSERAMGYDAHLHIVHCPSVRLGDADASDQRACADADRRAFDQGTPSAADSRLPLRLRRQPRLDSSLDGPVDAVNEGSHDGVAVFGAELAMDLGSRADVLRIQRRGTHASRITRPVAAEPDHRSGHRCRSCGRGTSWALVPLTAMVLTAPFREHSAHHGYGLARSLCELSASR